MTGPTQRPAWPPSSGSGGPAAPGWYPDTVGGTPAFRWWDGARWTQAVSDSLWTPEPAQAPPYVPPRPTPSGSSAPVEFELDLDEDEPRVSRPLLVGIAVVAVLVLVGLGFVAFGGGSGDQRASVAGTGDGAAGSGSAEQANGTQDADDSADDADGTEPTTEASPDPTPEATPSAPRLGWPIFETPGEDWWTGDESVVPHAMVRHLTTEENYSGDDDWIATVMAGEIPEEVEPHQELARTAGRVADWYAAVAFGDGRKPRVETLEEQPTMVADRPAHRLRVRMPYRLEGLEATSDDVEIVVMDLGPDRRPGLFLAAVPNTDPELWKICETVRESLSLRG